MFDYKALNAVTVTDNYRPPPIDMLIGATAGAKYYSFLDLEKGFWQLPIAEESQPATAYGWFLKSSQHEQEEIEEEKEEFNEKETFETKFGRDQRCRAGAATSPIRS